MNHDKLMQDWFDNKVTTIGLIHEVKKLRELLDEARNMMGDAHLHDTELYCTITKHLYGED